jgi:hypothetical protein
MGGSSAVVMGGSSMAGSSAVVMGGSSMAGSSAVVMGGSSMAGITSRPSVRVVFATTYGVPDDDEINTIVALENLGTESFPLAGVEVRYWAKMAFSPVECSCLTAVCNASAVGAFRTGRAEANTCISFALPSGRLAAGRSLSIDFVCRHTNGIAIDETSHYSYPTGLHAGDEIPRVTVSFGSKLIWGVEPL